MDCLVKNVNFLVQNDVPFLNAVSCRFSSVTPRRKGALRQHADIWGSRVMNLFSLVKEEYNQAFCIQNVVQYFWNGTLVCLEI